MDINQILSEYEEGKKTFLIFFNLDSDTILEKVKHITDKVYAFDILKKAPDVTKYSINNIPMRINIGHNYEAVIIDAMGIHHQKGHEMKRIIKFNKQSI